MKISVIRIGNSRGIRLPKTLIQQYRLGDSVELVAERDSIVIKPSRNPRAGWAEAARRVANLPDDPELKAWREFPNRWDKKGWKW